MSAEYERKQLEFVINELNNKFKSDISITYRKNVLMSLLLDAIGNLREEQQATLSQESVDIYNTLLSIDVEECPSYGIGYSKSDAECRACDMDVKCKKLTLSFKEDKKKAYKLIAREVPDVKHGRGYKWSAATPTKQIRFTSIIRMSFERHQRIITSDYLSYVEYSMKINKKFNYFDINAGAGYCGSNGEESIGSPLISLLEATKIGIPFSFFFFEKNYKDYKKLVYNCKNLPIQLTIHECGFYGEPTPCSCTEHENCVTIVNQNHSNNLLNFIRICSLKGTPFGLIYSDPSGSVPPFDLLGEITEVPLFKNMDIAINVASSNIIRVLKAPNTSLKENLKDLSNKIRRTHYLISRPFWKDGGKTANGFKWIFLYKSNFPIPLSYNVGLSEIGFVSAHSEVGIDLINDLTYSSGEKHFFASNGDFTLLDLIDNRKDFTNEVCREVSYSF